MDLVVKAKDRTVQAVRRDDGWKPVLFKKSKAKPDDQPQDSAETDEVELGETASSDVEIATPETETTEEDQRQAAMNVVVAPAESTTSPSPLRLEGLNFESRPATPIFEGLGAVDGFDGIWNTQLAPEVNEVLSRGFHLDIELMADSRPAPALLSPTTSISELFSDATPIEEAEPVPPGPPAFEESVSVAVELPPLPESRRSQLEDALDDLNRPISSISVTKGWDETQPRNLAAEMQPQLPPISIWGAPWPRSCPNRYTQPFCHRPLYFEEPNLERCGTNCCGLNAGIFQPGASMLHFVGNTLILPYRLVVRPPCVLQPTLGDCPTCHTFDCEALELLPVGYEPLDLTAFWSH